MSQPKIINVTAAVIQKDGLILIARRAPGKHLAGKWEFPGGKIEPGETPEECLTRELKEEFGITAEVKEFIAESVFDYGERTIRLMGYRVEYASGEFSLTAHDEIKWVRLNEFASFDFAEADLPIIARLIA